mgnify:CR=1 FL=1
MAKRLTDNINSLYFEAANRMTSKKARRKIVAYVESYDDVFFWRSVLGKFEDEKRYFDIMLPTRNQHLDRGKKAAISSMLKGVGRDMIACVDADYDYLRQGSTESSQQMLENPYIFHTYAYAIENLQCYAPSLHGVCVAVTLNDHMEFDFVDFLSQYSQAIFPLFIWSIWYYRTPRYAQFSITDFPQVIELGKVTPDNANDALQRLRSKVAKKVQWLQRHNPKAKESYLALKDELKRLGVTPDTTYLYIQGHHLFDRVVMPLMKNVCARLVREREREISLQSVHNTQYRNELSCYSSSISDITNTLKKSVGFLASEPYNRIVEDLTKAFEK